MAIVNHAKREINAKIVFYGPPGSGKATSLRYVYDRIKPALRGELKTLAASGSSLMFFDFNPFETPVFEGYRLCLHLYTLHGPVANPAAWKMTLKGADGVMVVMDASPTAGNACLESLAQLRVFLNGYGMSLEDTPSMFQMNKSDRADGGGGWVSRAIPAIPAERIRYTTAATGEGVLEALTALSRQVMDRVRLQPDMAPPEQQYEATPQQPPVPEPMPQDMAEEGAVEEMEEILEGELATEPDRPLHDLQVQVQTAGVSAEGETVHIPLEITLGGLSRRVTVSVTVRQAAGDAAV